MSDRLRDLVVLVFVAGAIAAVVRAMTRDTGNAKGRRGRLRELAWCMALLVLSAMVANTGYLLHNTSTWWIAVAIVALIIIVSRPRLAARLVPIALMLYGLFGFVVARDYFGGLVSYGLPVMAANSVREAYIILPQAYAMLLLGGYLTVRSADPVLTSARLLLGPVARAPLGEQFRTFALLPVIAVIAELLAPRLWLIGGAGLILTVVVVWGAVLVIRRWPRRAAQAATAALLCLGIAGLVIAAAWRSAGPAFKPINASAKPASAQPRASASAQPRKSVPARPRKLGVLQPTKSDFPRLRRPLTLIGPLKPGALPKPAPPASLAGPVVSPPPTWAADVADIGYGQALPFGAVLVSSPGTAEAAAVEGLAFLALGAWLAPQTFPRVRRMLGRASEAELSERVERLTKSRAVAVDTASADLRRLERDLHDGAQARLVALGMSLRAAERLIPTSPEAALALVVEARETSVRALTELRELVRGVLPPVLADRGLADAVRALALDSPLHVQTEIDLPGRLPSPVETACYFAVAELLTNAAKHSGARDARIAISHSGRLLRIEVTDFGLGGADPTLGSGLAGVEKRLATFDGILAVSSPAGGPTIVVMEVPCALSSPKTSSY
jgi:signal transduction histidine kinase